MVEEHCLVLRARQTGTPEHHGAGWLQALKSSGETCGSCLRKATIDHSSESATPIAPKLGMPVMRMPFLTTQNSWLGGNASTISERSGGLGFIPSENFAQSAPGPPWQATHPRSAK